MFAIKPVQSFDKGSEYVMYNRENLLDCPIDGFMFAGDLCSECKAHHLQKSFVSHALACVQGSGIFW